MADPKDRKGRMACGKLYLECAFKPEEMKCANKVSFNTRVILFNTGKLYLALILFIRSFPQLKFM